MKLTVEQMDLLPVAERAARLLLSTHPEVVFTSGRRNPIDQARAMSGNVSRNRQFIKFTYRPSALASSLQEWVDAHTDAVTPMAIATGLLSVFDSFPRHQVVKFSRHMQGLAFDVQPIPGPHGEAVKESIRQLPGLDKFLEREAGLVVWHAQFNAEVTT